VAGALIWERGVHAGLWWTGQQTLLRLKPALQKQFKTPLFCSIVQNVLRGFAGVVKFFKSYVSKH
jgi:hypothetical protein